jgi:hypothetical protein
MSIPQGEIGGRDNRVACRDYYERPVLVLAAPPGRQHCPACAAAWFCAGVAWALACLPACP